LSEKDIKVAILMADISGSSALYNDIGDTEAARRVGECLDNVAAIIERNGGICISSKGDDILATFDDTSAALEASCAMLSQQITGSSLAIHVGATFGNIVRARDDIFGDSVNTAARLSSLAKPGELLVSESFIEQLPSIDRRRLHPLDSVTFKGKDAATGIYTLLDEDTSMRTVIGKNHTPIDIRKIKRTAPAVSLTLRYADKTFDCPERMALSLGRSADNDVVIEQPWISREHANFQVRRGKVQLTDQSTLGTFVSVHPGYEFLLKRETALLIGTGTISPGIPPTAPEAQVIHYEVIVSQPDAADSD
jgi:class 3 adenylate cyclase